MSTDFQSVDILLFAMIAVFLAIRLRNALGRKDRSDNKFEKKFDEQPDENFENIIELPGASKANNDVDVGENELGPEKNNPWMATDIAKDLEQIYKVDMAFDVENFVVGCRVAFEMVLKAFVDGDSDTLKRLLNSDVYSNFLQAIQQREADGYESGDTLVEINTVELVEAFLEDKVANVTVKFVTDQIKVTQDKDGNVVDGDPKTVISVTDFWTFSRDTTVDNPNWTLVATRSLD